MKILLTQPVVLEGKACAPQTVQDVPQQIGEWLIEVGSAILPEKSGAKTVPSAPAKVGE